MEFSKLKLKQAEVTTFNLHTDLQSAVNDQFVVCERANQYICSIVDQVEFEVVNNYIEGLDLDTDFALWICYPKGTSKKYKGQVNVNRDDIRTKINPLVRTVSMVSLDADWSAMRLRNVKFSK